MEGIGVVGIRVQNRADKADDVQKIITKYGDSILSRMGVPSPDRFTGIITVTLEAEQEKLRGFISELKGIEGVIANYIVI